MRVTIINGRQYKCPLYLVRAGEGWQVRVPGEVSKYFADGQCGGTNKAYMAAMDYRRELRPITNQTRAVRNKETSNKLYPTGQAGVFFQAKNRPDRGKVEYCFQISAPGQPRATVYIGTDKTWQQNYDAKLEQAISMRQESIAQFIVHSHGSTKKSIGQMAHKR